MMQARKTRNQAKTVAVACDQLPRRAHGKEGSTVRVLRGLCKSPGNGARQLDLTPNVRRSSPVSLRVTGDRASAIRAAGFVQRLQAAQMRIKPPKSSAATEPPAGL